MEAAFGGSDAAGAWAWQHAYEACEAAQLLFLRRFGAAMRERAGSAAGMLAMLGRLAALLPSHTKRSAESEALQQFSTPLELGFVASQAAALAPGDLVLEPSAGTGLLASFAELGGRVPRAQRARPNPRRPSARFVSRTDGHAARRRADRRSSGRGLYARPSS